MKRAAKTIQCLHGVLVLLVACDRPAEVDVEQRAHEHAGAAVETPRNQAESTKDGAKLAPKHDCSTSAAAWESATPLGEVKVGNVVGVVLPLGAASAALCPCSRKTMGLADGYWMPALGDLEALEQKIQAAVRTATQGRISPPWQSGRYARQYLGVVRSGRRKIYVNLFPSGWNQSDWHRTVVDVCDGGADYVGAEFDPGTGRFDSVEANGES